MLTSPTAASASGRLPSASVTNITCREKERQKEEGRRKNAANDMKTQPTRKLISSRDVLAGPKPRRGSLFIGSKPKWFLSFCFSAARRWIVSTYQWCRSPRNLLGIRFANAAPPKNKKNSFRVFRCYK